MNSSLKICTALLLFSFAVTAQEKPNVLFILVDDLGINALNCYGNPLVESPNIDQLFAESMHFTNGYSNDPTCAPSRASIMSGQYAPRHKVYRVADRFKSEKTTLENMKYLPPQNNRVKGSGTGMALQKITIAEALKTNQYATAAYGKWHLGKKTLGIPHQGFDEGYEITGHYNFKTSPEQNINDPKLYSADHITEKTIDFMTRSVKDKKPFFAYVPYYLVHKPLEPKPEHLNYFNEKLNGNPDIGKDEIQVLAMIKSLDESVGQLMTSLKSLQVEEETIVVFTSDNGHYKTESNVFTQPYRGTKGETFEGGIRVPYLFKWKDRIAENSVSKEPIIHVDLYPTLLGLTQTEPPIDYILDGEDISPILLGEKSKTQREDLIWEYTNYARYRPEKDSWNSKWLNVIQSDGYKMTEDVETETYTLFNLNVDPYETKEISKETPEKVEVLKVKLEAWKKETGYEGPRPNPDYKKMDEVGVEAYPFRNDNLIPWSIVGFDVKERTPAERIQMVEDLGFSQYAFGGREKHIATMAEEIRLAEKANIKIPAVWLYINLAKDTVGKLKPQSEQILKALEETGLKAQIWVGMDPKYFEGLADEAAFEESKKMIGYLSDRAESLGCKIALYNHGGWFGNPKNQLQLIKALPENEIGIIHNFHHAHDNLDNYAENIKRMMPYLWCVNLNGMKKEGPKIITIGEGNLEKKMIHTLFDEGYEGPFGILGHVKGGDPEVLLDKNREGLQRLYPRK